MNFREFLDYIDKLAEKAYRLEFVNDYKLKNSQLISIFEEVRAINKELFNDSDFDKEISSIGEPYLFKNKNWNYRRGNLFRLIEQLRNRIIFRLDKEINDPKKPSKVAIDIVENRYVRAKKFLNNAKENLDYFEKLYSDNNWDKAVNQAVQSIEFSLKALLIILIGKFPRSHDFQDESSISLIKEAKNALIKKNLGGLKNFDRVFFITHFWSRSYTYSKYGGEYGESENVYKKIEADWAKYHALEAYHNTEKLYSILFSDEDKSS